MSSAHTLPLAIDRALRSGFFSVPDPGPAGTFSWHSKGYAIIRVSSAGAEDRTLPAATGYAVGTRLFVYASNLSGDVSILGADTGTVILSADGDHVEFMVVEDDLVPQWNALQGSIVNGVTAAAPFGTDGLLLQSDGTGRGAVETAIATVDLADLFTQVQGANVIDIPIPRWRIWDSLDAQLGATPTSADDLAHIVGTFLTDSPYITTTAQTPGDANPVVSYARYMVQVPENYQAGDAITLRIAWARPDAAATSMVLDAEVVRAGAPTVDINSTAAVDINGAASGTANFVLTPTNVVPGETLNIRINITAVSNGASYEGRVTNTSLVYTV